MTEPDWTSEVALVAGGSGDIGTSISQALAGRGARVAAADLREPRESLQGDRYRFELRDLKDPAAADEWVTSVERTWGAPSIAVVSVGISGRSRLIDTTPDEWTSVLASCLDASYYVAIAAVRSMVRAGRGGRIVFIGSWAAHAPHPHIGAYSVAKAGLRALCRTLALDHAADGILVNEVAPGVVDAGLSRALLRSDERLRERTMQAVPLGRLMSPDEVARDVLHLASPANRSTTGAVLLSDGGLSQASVMNTGRRD
jgi:glucose 1-dehydrogenase